VIEFRQGACLVGPGEVHLQPARVVLRTDLVALGARHAHPEQQQIRGRLVAADEGVDPGARRASSPC